MVAGSGRVGDMWLLGSPGLPRRCHTQPQQGRVTSKAGPKLSASLNFCEPLDNSLQLCEVQRRSVFNIYLAAKMIFSNWRQTKGFIGNVAGREMIRLILQFKAKSQQ